MKRCALVLAVMTLLAGCGHQSRTPTTKDVPAPWDAVATVSGEPISRAQLDTMLLESYGMGIMLKMVELKVAEQQAVINNVTISEQDVARERELALQEMFTGLAAADYEEALNQLLVRKNISRPIFDMVMRTNAYLRKIAIVQLKDAITDDLLKSAFGMIYGEKVQIRHIELTNMQEVAEAQRRLSAGEKFEDVAKAMSKNTATAPLGGELAPFTWNAPGLSDEFKKFIFSIKPGDTASDPIMERGAYHIIKMEQRIPPKAVKFEDMKDSVREKVREELIQSGVKTLRMQYALEARRTLRIHDPVLRKQFEDRTSEQETAAAEQEKLRLDLERQRMEAKARAATQATTTTAPATTIPTAPPEVRRPPATMPGK